MSVKTTTSMTRCPGCGLQLPQGSGVYEGYYHCTPECWSVYTEAIGAEFGNAPLFGRVHQLTVDTYALQHAGGDHKPKSITVHLVGLCLQLELGIASFNTAPRLVKLAEATSTWPHFEPPAKAGPLTVFDVAMADSPVQHEERVRAWAAQVWGGWKRHHAAAFELAHHLLN